MISRPGTFKTLGRLIGNIAGLNTSVAAAPRIAPNALPISPNLKTSSAIAAGPDNRRAQAENLAAKVYRPVKRNNSERVSAGKSAQAGRVEKQVRPMQVAAA